jgi:O-antigen/teichoic acid export membrane protein
MKSNTNLVLNHIAWRGLYFFTILLINIGIARFFAAEKSGQIFYIANNLSFIILLTSISLESGAVYYISTGKLDAVQMARFCVMWTLLATTIAAIIWWQTMGYTGSYFLGNRTVWNAGLIFISGVLLTTFFTSLFYSKKKFAFPNKLLFLVNIVFILLLLFANRWAWFKNNFLILYFLTYFLQGFLLMMFFFISNRNRAQGGLPDLRVLKKVISFSLVALTANFIYFLVNRMDFWFVERYCSATDLGNYIQASKLGQMLLIVPSILGSTFYPLIASGEDNQNMPQVARILFLINIILCLFILLTGYWLFPFLFGPSFGNMYFIFILLIPGLLALTANYPLAASNSGNNLVRRNVAGSVIALIIIAAGDFFILPMAGVRSAAVISSIGYLSYYCYVLILYRRDHQDRLTDYFIVLKSDFSWMANQLKRLTETTRLKKN